MSKVNFEVRVVRVILVEAKSQKDAKEAIEEVRISYDSYGSCGAGYAWRYKHGAKIVVMRNKKGGRRGH